VITLVGIGFSTGVPTHVPVICVVMLGKFVFYFGLQKFAQSWSDKNAHDVLISSVT
jgi:hypothetical protein